MWGFGRGEGIKEVCTVNACRSELEAAVVPFSLKVASLEIPFSLRANWFCNCCSSETTPNKSTTAPSRGLVCGEKAREDAEGLNSFAFLLVREARLSTSDPFRSCPDAASVGVSAVFNSGIVRL